MKYVKLFAVMLVAALMVVMGCEKTKKMSSEGGPDSMGNEGQIDPGMMDGMGEDPGEEGGEEGGDEGGEEAAEEGGEEAAEEGGEEAAEEAPEEGGDEG